MKKTVSIVTILSLGLCLLAGCGSNAVETPASSSAAPATEAATSAAASTDKASEPASTEEASEPASTDAAAPASDSADAAQETQDSPTDTKTDNAISDIDVSGVKVGFIFLHDENSTYDLNFLNAAKETCKKMGFSDDQFIYRTNIPEGQECYDAACELADMGCSVIFADSFGHEDYMIQAAKEFPEVQFCHATGTKAHTEGLPNYQNAFASIYNGRYLAGVAAGLKLNEMIEAGEFTAEEAKIGYVGAFTYAEVISGYTSFFLGARSICPSATMEVTFTGSWYDETAEKEGANTLINDGCKLISQHADSMGAPTACETAGIPNVSYNGSTVAACPNTFIVSTRIDWAPYYEYVINSVLKGEAIGSDWIGDISTGSVVMTEVNEKAAAPNTQSTIEQVRADLESGKVHVFDTSAFTVNGEKLTSYMADVDTDPAYEGDTEAISDGYFHESEYRSAPYFDLRIDGISLLNESY